jgi:UDPglucose--hexose-1-phosphate uridylyltransferase
MNSPKHSRLYHMPREGVQGNIPYASGAVRAFDNPDSEIRKHYFLDRYVIIAPKRSLRPDSFTKASQPDRPVATKPAFAEDESILQADDALGEWQVRVVKNLYSALSLDNNKAYGTQEIVVDTPDYRAHFSDLSVDHIGKIFEVFIQRGNTLRALSGIRYVVVFKNNGPRAGASIAHSHSQIIAIPFIPPTVALEAAAYDQYVRENGSSPFLDIIRWEQEQKVRVIFEDEHTIAISPYAVREAFGVWIIPKVQRANFADLTTEERQSVASFLKLLTTKLDSSNIDYNFMLQDSLPGEKQHFHLKLEPRPNIWAGFELSTGVIINPVSPEYAAEWYRSN